jgi:hypothetical protein
MKKFLALTLLAALLAAPSAQAREAGGLAGGIVGCCFGIRTAAAWNEGKNLEIREWLRIVPIAGIVAAIWNAVDGWNGVTTADLRKMAGEAYY